MIPKSSKSFNDHQQGENNQVTGQTNKIKVGESDMVFLSVSDESDKSVLLQPGESGSKHITQPESQANQVFSEEAKLESTNTSNIQQIIWEWKCDSGTGTSELGKWTPYSLIESNLLEQAYQSKERRVILEEGIVYISDNGMFQQRKENTSEQRQVRRSEKNNKRVERFIGGEIPKTYSNPFGSLDDYLSFFENRTPEMASFVEMFQKAETDQDLDILFKGIVPAVIDCILKEANKLKKMKVKKSLIARFQKSFLSFEEFYGTILKVYTMETFLYRQLNEYLRNEDWTQLNELLPYAFCLCKAFQCPKLTSACNTYMHENGESQDNSVSNLVLYRGAVFDEASLSCYMPERVSTFSWNAVTSTSTNLNVAKFFSESSELKNKISVIFTIEVAIPSTDSLRNLNLIDIKTLSESPEEEEIVLAPGSIFELKSCTRNDNKAQVKLRLITDARVLPLQGKIMSGAMHVQVSKGKVAKISCQGGRGLMEALDHLRGNRMAEVLELGLCRFDERTLKALTLVLPTLPKLRKVILFSNDSDQNDHLEIIVKTIGKLKIRSIEVNDHLLNGKNYFSFLFQEIGQWSISSLNMEFKIVERWEENCVKIGDNGEMYWKICLLKQYDEKSDQILKNLCSKGLRYLTSLAALSIHFPYCEGITDEGVQSLCLEGLRYLTSLTSLTLDFRYCYQITDEGVQSLCLGGLRYLTLLTSLSINLEGQRVTTEYFEDMFGERYRDLNRYEAEELYGFDEDDIRSHTIRIARRITGEGVKALYSVLRHLTFLRTLSLNFDNCGSVNEGAETLRDLSSLTTLTLNFDDCYLTDQDVKTLRHLTLLTTLSLNFKMTAERVETLCLEGLRYLSSLTTLSLNLTSGYQSNYTRIKSVFSELETLRSFQCFTLNLAHCYELNDKGIRILCIEPLRYFTSLTTLALQFEKCHQITDELVNSLCSEGLIYLTSLKVLTLDFKRCTGITEKGVTSLCSEGLRNLKALTGLTLDVGKLKITDEGVKSLCSEGLRYLTSLTAMSLNFEGCSQITDEGVRSLCLEGFKYLNLLTTLSLNFDDCYKITDEGVKCLCSEVITYLTSLTSLALVFKRCDKITEEGVNFLRAQTYGLNLSLVLSDRKSEKSLGVFKVQRHLTPKPFKSVTMSDSPSFSAVDSLFMDSTYNLSSLLSKKEELQLLSSLKIEFKKQELQIQGLCSEVFRYLTSLTNLSLNFTYCEEITDVELETLCSEGLRSLNSLTALTLNFSKYDRSRYIGYDGRWSNAITRALITKKGINILCSEGLRHLTSLTTLSLYFTDCEKMTDVGLKSLCSEGLRHLTLLTNLSLNFERCQRITLEGVNTLCAEGLRYLTSLTTLSLDFTDCEHITDVELVTLCSEGLRHLTLLTTLSLNFERCEEITQDGVNILCSEGLRDFASLTTLSLNFGSCRNITNVELKILCSEGFGHLASLTTLTLNFNRCSELEYVQLNDQEVVNILFLEGIRYLPSLTDLTLNFGECQKMTDEGVNILCSEGLRYLTSLTTLSLNFEECGEITHEGVTTLCTEGLKHLTSLRTLTLEFSSEMTDEGVNSLCSEGLRYLTSLTTLSLNFSYSQITDEGINCLYSLGLSYLNSLTALALNFPGCSGITDEGVKRLCLEGFRHLKSLITLDMDFKDCVQISESVLFLDQLHSVSIPEMVENDNEYSLLLK